MSIAAFFHDIKQRSIAIWYENGKLKAFLPNGSGLTGDEKALIDGRRADILSALKANKVFSRSDFNARRIFSDLNDDGSRGLSFAQERLWFIEQFEGGSSAYHIPMAFDLGPGADRGAFKKGVQSVVSRHEVLRTVFRKDDQGNDYQLVLDEPPQIAEEQILEQDLPTRLTAGINGIFDLVEEGPLKVFLFDTGKSLYCLIVVHHIAFDGWSGEVFLNELEKFYLHYKDKETLALPEPGIQYKDFALWQKTWLCGDELRHQLDYWKNTLQDYETLELPTDKPRPSRVDYHGDTVGFELGKALSAKLKKTAKDNGVTLFSLLLSAFFVLLNKYCGQNSLVVGTPVANRHYDQLENLIGFFVNSMALSAKLEGRLPFETLVQNVHRKTVEAQQYQDLPFEKLVDALGVAKDLSRHPVFQVMFGVESFAINDRRLFKALALDTYYNPAKFDLSLFINDGGPCLTGRFTYAVSLFHPDTIRRLREYFINILEQVAKDQRVRLRDISILSDEAYDRIVYEWNRTCAHYPAGRTIVGLFEDQVAKSTDDTAVIFKDFRLTYGQLNERVNQLAHTIRRDYKEFTGEKVTGDVLIGIYIERSPEMVIGILGILKSGAAYVPFDSADPQERLKFKINNCGCKLVLSTSDRLEDLVFLAETDTIPMCLDSYDDEIGRAPVRNPSPVNKPSDLAYIIYTSGSTGRPKGVMLEHRSVINYVENFKRATASGRKTMDLSSSLSFDLTVTTTLAPLLTGSTIAVYHGSLKDIDAYIRHIEKNKVTFIKTVPSLLYLLLQRKKPLYLKEIFVGGEKLNRDLLLNTDSLHIFDEYGPTEATVGTTLSTVCPDNQPGIGKAYDNYQVYILDARNKPVPVGAAGELFIGGDGLARGYFKRPELTAERFMDNPFSTQKQREEGRNQRIYKTGDLARWLADGNIEYLGRNDDQVKIRGFRIELGEIEERLSEHPAIRQCVVLCREFHGNKYLAAYYICQHGLSVDALKKYMTALLPDYMVPAHFIELDQMPLTVNGKVNRRILPEPDITGNQADYTAPRNDRETILCRLWKEELGIERVGITDDFFQLGGNSILAIKLTYKMTRQLQIEIPVAALFEHKTVKGISEALTGFKRLITIEPCSTDTPALSFAQERLYFIEQYEGGSTAYNIPMFFELAPGADTGVLKQSLQGIVHRHEVLRTVFARTEGGEVYQEVRSSPLLVDDRHIAQGDLTAKVTEAVNTRFDLHHQYPIKAIFYHTGKKSFLLITFHHIAFDGWSTDVFLHELNLFYRHCKDGTPLGLPDLDIQYRDFAVWQRDYLSGERLDSELDYWRDALAGYEPLEFPLDKIRPAEVGYEGDYFDFELDNELSVKLREAGKRYRTTPYTLFLSAFYILLHKYSGQNDIVIGTPTANRHYAQLQHLIGFFVNSTVMRCAFTPGLRIRALIEKTASLQAAMQMHQDLPFEKLVELLKLEKDPARHPIFQIMFSVQSFGDINKPDNSVLRPLAVSDTYKVSKFDLSLFIDDSKERISASFNYATGLFQRATIARLARHYNNILSCIAAGEDRLISDVQLLSPAENDQIIHDWNETYSDYPKDRTIIDVFEKQANGIPDHIALVFKGEKRTYGELNAHANQLAHTIRASYREFFGMPVKAGMLIGLYLERSVDMITAILGILKSGAAYVPFDRADPGDRLRLKINDCHCKMILTTSECLSDLVFLADEEVLPLSIDSYQDEICKNPTGNPERVNGPGDLAYVIYTSGSTGTPKGVMIEHQGVINLARSHKRSFEIGTDFSILQFAPLSFDASVSTLFCTLLNGGRLCLCSEALRKDVDLLAEFIVSEKINLIDIPAKLLEVLPRDIDLTDLGTIITAGEVCDLKTMDYWGDRVRLVNAYGPTEATVCTTFSIHRPGMSNRNIGRPISNKKVYVLDPWLTPVPVGVPGELCIGGDGLARGYLGRPEITAESFIENRFLQEISKKSVERRMYRTGDLVRWLKDGSLEFMGRNDDQVKVRGFRIELGEVENKLASVSGIAMCAIKIYQRNGNKHLAAYYTLSENLTADEIRDRLAVVLPDYMLPSYFTELDEFPYNSSGKIDRKALPDPLPEMDQDEYTAPRSDLEKRISTIFGRLLGLDKVGITDDFFRIGGDSILSIQLCSALRHAGLSCAVKDIFKNPTVLQLSEYLEAHQEETPDILAEQGLLEGEFDLLPIQSWFFDRVREKHFKKPGHWNQSFMIRVPDPDPEILSRCLTKLAERHDMLRASFAGGKQRFNRTVHLPQLKVLDRGDDKSFLAALTKWQGDFNLEHGPLWQCGIVRGYEDGSSRIYFALHHLIVDSVSWRILIDDLRRLFEKESLGEKTSSYRQWVNTLKQYPKKHSDEKPYWQSVISSLPDYRGYTDKESKPRTHKLALTREVTKQLIKDANGAYYTQINDLLLTAFACALKDWQGSSTQGITLEGHGRENIDAKIDHSRTMGWFTTVYPVTLEVKKDLGRTIQSVKQSLRQLPNKGVGWGAFCCFDTRENTDPSLDFNRLPPISFNYLGQMDSGSSKGFWQVVDEPSGTAVDPLNEDNSLIAVNGITIDGQLKFNITTRLPKKTAQRLTQKFQEFLEAVTSHCLEVMEKGIQPGYNIEDFEYIPTVLLNRQARSNKLVIMIHPDSGYEAYMATLYPALPRDVKVLLIDNFYKKVYLRDGVAFQKHHFNGFRDLAGYYAQLLLADHRELLLNSECCLLGYSFGSPLAYEMDSILKANSIRTGSMLLIDPLIPALLETEPELECFEWYRHYHPEPTTTPVINFRCLLPDPSLPHFSEYFVDPQGSYLEKVAREVENISINCPHTAILDNPEFLRQFKKTAGEKFATGTMDVEPPQKTDAGKSSMANEIKQILRSVIPLDRNQDIDDDEIIFLLGCTSIQTLSVLALLNEQYHIDLTLPDIIQDFTVSGLISSVLETQRAGQSREEWKPVEFATVKADAPSMYFFPGLIGSVASYSKICRSLSERFSVVFLEPKGMYGTLTPFNSYQEAVQAYAEQISAREEKKSPIYLAGHSVGSIHALDTALILEQEGFNSLSVINLDGYLHGIKDIKESIQADNLDEALLEAIKIFFTRAEKQGQSAEGSHLDPLQEIASILFPHESISRDYALRVALGYRNIWHQQLGEMLNYKEPQQKLKSRALVLIAQGSGEAMGAKVIQSCKDRCAGAFQVKRIPGDHLSCITEKPNIEGICAEIRAWTAP